MGFFKKIFGGLAKTAGNITKSIAQIFTKELDDDFYDDLTAVLLTADMGLPAVEQIVDDIKHVAKKQGIKTEEALRVALAKSIADILAPAHPFSHSSLKPAELASLKQSSASNSNAKADALGLCQQKIRDVEARGSQFFGGMSQKADAADALAPLIILVVGVNGVGKTTSIGKLAAYYRAQKKSVLVVAADTFRAAATEQLDTWATRAGVRIVKQNQGADPASVVFDGLTSAMSKHDDVVIIDTAGRLHNKSHLMEELKKIDRVVGKFTTGGARYVKMLVLDATTGQNALNQVEVFNDAMDGGLDGVILTKLDGTAKGGVVVAIKQQFGLVPVFVGVGEKLDDLIPFDAHDFAKALVGIE